MHHGYADRLVTKAPNWHGLVALDTLFNNMTSGLFLVAALGELFAPTVFAVVARAAYPIALALLLADLVCLVVELGDPLRFHHMLRVFKPTSPMSFGTWCLTVYALPLTVLALLSFLPNGTLQWARRPAMILGLLPALGIAVYKGVLFSTTAQPGWRDARWLGGYLASSAVMLGAAQMLMLSMVMGQSQAAVALRPAVVLLLLLNAVSLGLVIWDVRTALTRAHERTTLGGLIFLVVGGGVFAPLALLAVGGPMMAGGAVLLILLGALLVRTEIIRLPHLLAQTPVRGR
ncbi:MAG TPA: NrfD/PsrC family molybdoenzyme membrane anchor subunit [Gemmatimonadales bacterium]|jgi:Ni/Fe-hydrogenase subunit HybB-like protein|nr:NrfD/PsrC family molybdoenzyme membrane anchor subunit [Gemmatimonadales bacterium]